MTPQWGLDRGTKGGHYAGMNRFVAICILIFALTVIAFGTWQLFEGNFEAAFTALPFLVIIFLFVKRHGP